jgi:hypothetical protein
MHRATVARARWGRSFPPAAIDLLVVLGSAWLVRAVVMATWPGTAHSDDLDSWMRVADELRRGANPYVTTTIVKWPPFAIVLVWTIDHVAEWLGVTFFTVMRATLVVAESAVAIVLYLLMTQFAPARAVRRVLLVGVSLNPIAILFVCQHENIDVFVGLFVVLALWALVSYERTGDAVAWLAACLAFGLGAFAKTIPLVLAPLLAPGLRAASRLGRALGAALFLGPFVLSLSIVFALAPRAVADNVLRYRSIRGYFGITGLLGDHDGLSRAYERFFTVALLVGVVLLFRLLWRRGLDERRTILLAALVLAAVPALGPGYAPQYAYWFIPPLIATYPLFDDGWRKILIAWYAVAALTSIFEYGLVGALGSFLVAFFEDSGSLQRLSERVSTPGMQTVVRLPLFAAFLVLLVAGGRRLKADRSVG